MITNRNRNLTGMSTRMYVSGEENAIATWDANNKFDWNINDGKELATIMLNIKAFQMNYIQPNHEYSSEFISHGK